MYTLDCDHLISFRVEDSGRPKVRASFRVNSILTLNTSKLQTLPESSSSSLFYGNKYVSNAWGDGEIMKTNIWLGICVNMSK